VAVATMLGINDTWNGKIGNERVFAWTGWLENEVEIEEDEGETSIWGRMDAFDDLWLPALPVIYISVYRVKRPNINYQILCSRRDRYLTIHLFL